MIKFFDPSRFGIELLFSVIVVFLCLFIYYKTKDMYELSKHKGIKYFRVTFLLFGLAYFFRFLTSVIFITTLAFDFFIPKSYYAPLVMIPVGYVSTLALFYLIYGVFYKKIKYSTFIVFSNIVSVLVALISFLSHSPFILLAVQLPLILFFVFFMLTKKKGPRTLYILISIFWLLSLLMLGPKRNMPIEVILVLELISVLIFILIYKKVSKWVK